MEEFRVIFYLYNIHFNNKIFKYNFKYITSTLKLFSSYLPP